VETERGVSVVEVGYFNTLSRDRSEVRGFIFAEPVFAYVAEVLQVIGEDVADERVPKSDAFSAPLYNIIGEAQVGDLSYDVDLDAVVIRLRQSNCGCDLPYIVATNDLHDLILHGVGRAAVREEL